MKKVESQSKANISNNMSKFSKNYFYQILRTFKKFKIYIYQNIIKLSKIAKIIRYWISKTFKIIKNFNNYEKSKIKDT